MNIIFSALGFKVSERDEKILTYQAVSSGTHFVLQQLLLMIVHCRISTAGCAVLNYSPWFNPEGDIHACVKFHDFSRFSISMLGGQLEIS